MSSPKTTFREREEAVHAITERNRLKKRIAATHEDSNDIQERLGSASRRSDEQEVKRLLGICQEQEKTLQETQLAITQYDDQVESIKARMRDEENVVRRRAEEARWRAEWERGQQFHDLPGFGSRLEPGAMVGFLGASVLLAAAVIVLLLWLR